MGMASQTGQGEFAMNELQEKPAVATRIAGFLAGLCLLSGAGPAVAQTAEQAAEPAGLDEIIVTARFREEKLQETPIAITAITGAELEDRNIYTASDVGYLVPNASFRPAQAAFGNTMTAYIRGIGQYDFDFAFEPGVGIYVDDVYHPFTLASQIDLLDIDHVEVLRGPQGTLFGRGAIGGAVRYVSKKPQGDETGQISVVYGDFNRIDVRASYDFSIGENLFARVAGVSKQREGYQKVIDFACAFPALAGRIRSSIINRGKDCQIGTQGGEDVTGARGALRWAPSDKFEVTLTGEYTDDDSEARADYLNVILEGPAQGALYNFWESNYVIPMYGIPYDTRFYAPNIYTTYATYDDQASGLSFRPETSVEKWDVSANMQWRITDSLTSTLILSYTDIDSRFATDADGSPLNVQTVDGTQPVQARTAELRFNGTTFSDRLDWTLGAFFYNSHATNTQTVSIPPLSMFLDLFLAQVLPGTITFPQMITALDTTQRSFVNAKNVHQLENQSVYGHVVLKLNDKIDLQAGVRYSKDQKNVDFDNTRVVAPGVEIENKHTDWRFGLDWKFTEAMMSYISASSGYRPAAYNSRPFQPTQVVGVEPEEAISYELGFKADFFDGTWRTNFAVFDIDYKTRILPVAGTECTLQNPQGPPPYIYNTVPPGTPGSTTDTLGNVCLATVSRTFYTNAPGDVQGFEFETMWKPIDALTVTANFGILDWQSQDVDDCDFNLDGNPDAGITCESDRPGQVPEWNWAAGVAYEFGTGGGGTITPRVDAFGQAEICFGPVARLGNCADGYTLVNAQLEYTDSEQKWTLAAGVTNLGNTQYFLNTFPLVAFGQPHSEAQPGRPREWYVSIRRDFH
jgi:iron complex outermembrane receptor protein